MGKKEFDPPFVFEVDPELNIDFDFNNPMYRSIVTLNAMNAQDALKDSEKQVARQMGDRLKALIDAFAIQYKGREAVLTQYKHVLALDTKAAHYHPIGEAAWWWEDVDIQELVVEYILKPISSQGDTAICRAREDEEEQEEYRRLGDDDGKRTEAGSLTDSPKKKGGPGTGTTSRQSHYRNDLKDGSTPNESSGGGSRGTRNSLFNMFSLLREPDGTASSTRSAISKFFSTASRRTKPESDRTSLSPPSSSNAERKGLP